MTPQEIVKELRNIASYSTSKKDVCTQAADLIESVVRCKDCVNYSKFSNNVEKSGGVCWTRAGHTQDEQYYCVADDDFCSYGKRRTK